MKKIDKIISKFEYSCALNYQDICDLIGYIEHLETKLDLADEEDLLGTEGWRHFCEVSDG